MEHPVHEIAGVVKHMTTGSRDEQEQALKTYFLPDASFVHPFCRVPPLREGSIPILSWINSRWLIISIYRWYRILSPDIDLNVKSAVLDQRTNKLFVDISQTFRVWFIPFYRADVSLISVLQLSLVEPSENNKDNTNNNRSSSSSTTTDNALAPPTTETGQTVSFADAVRLGTELEGEVTGHGGNSSAVDADSAAAAAPHRTPSSLPQRRDSRTECVDHTRRPLYYIAQQEDLYQVNEFVKFVFPWGSAFFWYLWQVFSSLMCVVLAVVFLPLFGKGYKLKIKST